MSLLRIKQSLMYACQRRKKDLLDDRGLDSIPPADKDKDMDKFLNSIPVTSKSDLSPSQQNLSILQLS